MSAGRGFWDVVFEHPIEVAVVTVLAMWTVRGMWTDFWVSKRLTSIAQMKLEKDKDASKETSGDTSDDGESN